MFVGNTAPDQNLKASASALNSPDFKLNFSWSLHLPCHRKALPMKSSVWMMLVIETAPDEASKASASAFLRS